MIYLLLFYVISVIGSIFYIKWFNTHFNKGTEFYFPSDMVFLLFIPVINLGLMLVATIILSGQHNILANISQKFSAWWDGDK